MRCMNRNKVRFFYALYEGREFITDEYGNVTGEYEVKYSNPTEFRANISPAMGETLTRQFGDSVSYDKVIVLDSDAPLLTNIRYCGLTSSHSLTRTVQPIRLMIISYRGLQRA